MLVAVTRDSAASLARDPPAAASAAAADALSFTSFLPSFPPPPPPPPPSSSSSSSSSSFVVFVGSCFDLWWPLEVIDSFRFVLLPLRHHHHLLSFGFDSVLSRSFSERMIRTRRRFIGRQNRWVAGWEDGWWEVRWPPANQRRAGGSRATTCFFFLVFFFWFLFFLGGFKDDSLGLISDLKSAKVERRRIDSNNNNNNNNNNNILGTPSKTPLKLERSDPLAIFSNDEHIPFRLTFQGPTTKSP